MAKAKLEKGLLVETPDKKGMLARISSAIASSGVNIRTICAYAGVPAKGGWGRAYFMMVTSNNQKVIKALKPLRFKIKKEEVALLELEDKVGALAKASQKLSKSGINLKYIYGTTSKNKKACLLVFSSNNNKKAVKVLAD